MYEKYGKDFYKRLKTVPSNCLDKYGYNKIKNACAIRLKTVNSMNGLVVSKLMVKFHDNVKKETRKFKFLPIFNEAQVKFKDKNEKVHRTPYAEAVYRFITSTSFGKPMSPTINKRVVYTCIIGNYDTLKPIMCPGDGIDYICFTDDMTMATPRPWKLTEIPKDLRNLPPVKQQRVLKILPHIYLQDYQESLWIDANFQVNADLNYFFRKYDLQKCPIYTNKHPQRDCIYDEQKTCVKLGKDKDAVTLPQIERFRKEGFPRHYGLAETNLMLRSHADEKCN